MAETVKKLKINKLLASQPCAHCGDELKMGEAGAVCEACESPHHERCWDEKNGCGQKGCINEPLKQIPDAPRLKFEKPMRHGESRCPSCGDIVDRQFCMRCNQPVISAGGDYPTAATVRTFATTRAPGISEALTYGILGVFCLGFIFGPLAISNANKAQDQIARDPSLEGAGLATFAKALGIFDLVAWVLVLFLRLSGRA